MSPSDGLEGDRHDDGVFQNDDDRLVARAARVAEKRTKDGLDELIGDLQCVIINTEPERQKSAVNFLLRYTGLGFDSAFQNEEISACILKKDGGADFMITSHHDGRYPFAALGDFPKSRHIPNTRFETLVFRCKDIREYVKIQKALGVKFHSEDIIDAGNFLFIQTPPSAYTGNSLGFIQWVDTPGVYSAFRNSKPLDWRFEKPNSGYQQNICHLDHAATRVTAEHRDPAILEFMSLTNYKFQFAIYVKPMNSITNVARLQGAKFAMVFTSGVSPYVNDEVSGPTEKFVHNYGARLHHLAFHTENIEDTFAALKNDGMEFLIELVGSPEEGLKQTFTVPCPDTLIVNEYIHRFGDFDGFFTKSNVALLTEASGKQ